MKEILKGFHFIISFVNITLLLIFKLLNKPKFLLMDVNQSLDSNTENEIKKENNLKSQKNITPTERVYDEEEKHTLQNFIIFSIIMFVVSIGSFFVGRSIIFKSL
jgi:hypothetical protein